MCKVKGKVILHASYIFVYSVAICELLNSPNINFYWASELSMSTKTMFQSPFISEIFLPIWISFGASFPML